MSEKSESYEMVARGIVKTLRERFGLATVEDKQNVPGASGTSWEIDGKAIDEDGERFFIVEARRHTTKGLEQEQLGAIAFRIKDTGASGAFVISPLPLQRGAEMVARAASIKHLQVSADSTPDNYIVEFLVGVMREIHIGMTDYATVRDSLTITLKDAATGEVLQQSVDGVETIERRDAPE
ncbi:MAG: hypothetical protein ABIT01_00985 [Thermoanaerobaculia bacterium]